MGCDGFGSHACTLVGCQDGLAVNVTVDAAAVAAGTHTLSVTADDATMTCTFAFPPPAPDAGTYGMGIHCPTGLVVSLLPVRACSNCLPTDGQFTEEILIAGTPSSVHLQQVVGGSTILDQTLAASYKTVAPNGESCGPICHEGTAALSIP